MLLRASAQLQLQLLPRVAASVLAALDQAAAEACAALGPQQAPRGGAGGRRGGGHAERRWHHQLLRQSRALHATSGSLVQQQPEPRPDPLAAAAAIAAADAAARAAEAGAGAGRLARPPPLFRQAPGTKDAPDGGEGGRQRRRGSGGRRRGDDAAAAADLRSPASWFALARSMERKLFAHLGPTNSGKTHTALQALAVASSGVYCGPLRLLACEVADRLNAAGVPCHLITGQEVRLVAGARHTACTIEMADLDRQVEVAVVDEVQLLSDKARGGAWTRAVLGLPAQELHLCGDPAAAQLLGRLAADCGDPLSLRSHRRLSPLTVEARALPGLAAVQPGDCLVAFGRRQLHRLRKHVLRGAGGRLPGGVGLVYGALPPEVRRAQAALFNAAPDSWPRYSVLVASDAVGMGLNLQIRRVVFASMRKYDGKELRQLTPSEVKQIAGRAGRYGGAHAAAGSVTCLCEDDMPLLREALATPGEPIGHACLTPRFEQLEQFSLALSRGRRRSSPADCCRRGAHADEDEGKGGGWGWAGAGARGGRVPFNRLLQEFAAEARLSGPYRLADLGNWIALAKLLRHLEPGMDLEDMHVWCSSPAGADDPAVVKALLSFASRYVRDRRVSPDCIGGAPVVERPATPAAMHAAEERFRVLDLYLWLAPRVGPGVFSGRREVARERQQLAALIEDGLRSMGGIGADGGGGGRPGEASHGGDEQDEEDREECEERRLVVGGVAQPGT